MFCHGAYPSGKLIKHPVHTTHYTGSLLRSVTFSWQGVLSDPGQEEKIIGRHPMGRLGTLEEIAESVVWFCSDAASFVTGHTMTVDGGYVAQ